MQVAWRAEVPARRSIHAAARPLLPRKRVVPASHARHVSAPYLCRDEQITWRIGALMLSLPNIHFVVPFLLAGVYTESMRWLLLFGRSAHERIFACLLRP